MKKYISSVYHTIHCTPCPECPVCSGALLDPLYGDKNKYEEATWKCSKCGSIVSIVYKIIKKF